MNKTQQRIIEAVARGYRVDGGKLIGPRGVLKVRRCGKQRYPTFSTNWSSVFGVPVHQFAAYQYFGEASFKKDVVIRHLNADTEDFSEANLALGTHSENNLDKPKMARSAAASKARQAQGVLPPNAKLTKEEVQEIRDIYEALGGKKAPNGFTKALTVKYGVSRTVLTHIKNRKYYASYSD